MAASTCTTLSANKIMGIPGTTQVSTNKEVRTQVTLPFNKTFFRKLHQNAKSHSVDRINYEQNKFKLAVKTKWSNRRNQIWVFCAYVHGNCDENRVLSVCVYFNLVRAYFGICIVPLTSVIPSTHNRVEIYYDFLKLFNKLVINISFPPLE